jgi:hypothetical protein
MLPHEFVCADCKSQVFSYGGEPDATRCASCETIAEMKAEGKGMSPAAEAALRELLGCQLPTGDEDGVRGQDQSSG